MTSPQPAPTQPASNPATTSAIAVLSGGLDSVVAMADALETQTISLAITFNYGQRAFQREKQATEAICKHYNLPHRIIDLPWLESLLPETLSLKQKMNRPQSEPKRLTQSFIQPSYQANVPEATKQVWVPNRNGVFLNMAAAYAEALGAGVVIFGANADEAQGFPDNTQTYRDRLNATFEYSTLNHIKVVTPVGEMTKAEIIERGMTLNAPLHLIWSCYELGPLHCGECASCKLLKQAIETQAESGKTVPNLRFMN